MLREKIVFGSLNTRGLKDIVKRKALFLFCKGQKSHCLFLQETHSSEANATFCSNQWGGKILFSHGSNRSGGVAICFNNFPGEVVTHRSDENGHWLTVVTTVDYVFLIMINVYGFNNNRLNEVLLEDLTNVIADCKIRYPSDHILIGGDWNMTPNEWLDRWPPRFGNQQHNDMIKTFMLDNYWLVSDSISRFTSSIYDFKSAPF